MRVEIYTDGACSDNGAADAPGGWAYYMRALRSNNGKKDMIAEKQDSGNKRGTTNNEMELKAILEALKRLKPNWAGRCNVHIYTDSKYCRNIFEEHEETIKVNGKKQTVMKPGWIHAWKRNWWRTSTGTPVANREIIEQIYELICMFKTYQPNKGGGDVRFHWVRGHAGHPINTRVDELAVAAKMELMQSA